MLNTIALCIGYSVMSAGGVAIAGAIAWAAIEYGYGRYMDYKLLREFFVWKRDRDVIPG